MHREFIIENYKEIFSISESLVSKNLEQEDLY
jgi:hypothetical protein